MLPYFVRKNKKSIESFNMIVSFLILNYNSAELTSKYAKTVSNYKLVNQVIIVDNCSTDNSYEELVTINTDKIHVVKSERNGGYSYGNNWGARYSQQFNTELLFISNPDVYVSEENVNKIISAFELSDYAILSGVEYDINNKISNPPIWKMNKYVDDLGECFYISRLLSKRKKKIDVNYSSDIQNTDIVKGSFLAVRLVDYMDIGGFDEGVFLFSEERIIAKKMKDAGKKVGIVTDATYQHNHSVSINKSYKKRSQQMKLLYQSRLYYNKKYEKVNGVKLAILKAAMGWSLFEFYIADLIKGN